MSEPPPSDGGPAPTSVRLRQGQQHILKRWEERVRAQLPTAHQHDSLALLDSLPVILEELAALLSHPSPQLALEQQVGALSARHGEEQTQAIEYSLAEVISEYQLLRQVLFEVLEAQAPLSAQERNLLLDALHLGIGKAAYAFMRLRVAEQEAVQAKLREANERLDRLVRERTDELSQSEEKFRLLVEGVKDYAIFTVDPHGLITSWNAGAQRMKGYAGAEVIGHHFSMLYPEEGKRRDEPMAHLRTAAIEGRFRGEGIRLRKNGELFLADVLITPIYDQGELRGFSKVVQDLTERNLLMQERDLSRSDVERLTVEATYRERFVATLTHDLRSPLSAAKTSAELITRSPEKHDKVRIWAFRIMEAVDRTDRMIADLLDASRVQAGEPLPLRFGPCDVKQLAEEVSEELSTRHGRRFFIDSRGPTTGVWSEEGLRRVLDNLLSNAIKYGEPTSPITVRIRPVEQRMLMAVHNQGTLIPTQEQSKLFTPFHRTPSAQTSGAQGWGLGLTLVKAIVEAHGGIVKVESYPKEGTTFTVDLPVVVSPPPSRKDGATV